MIRVIPAAAAALSLAGCATTATATTTAAPATSQSPWVDASTRTWRTDLPARLEIASTSGIAPGAELQQLSGDGATIRHCSFGAVVEDSAGTRGALETGHCAFDAGGAVTINSAAVGTYTNTRDTYGGSPADVALLRLNPGVQIASGAMRLGGLPVDGVLAADTARALPQGTSVCMQGYRAGVVCGHLDAALSTGLMVTVDGAQIEGGNSGGAGWIVDTTGRAVVVGPILEAASFAGGSSVTIALAEPMMRAAGLTIVRG